MPLTHHISISAQAQIPKPNPSPLPVLISSSVTLTVNEHAIVSTLGCHTLTQSPSSLPCQKSTPCKVRVVFYKPVYAVRVRGGPPHPNHCSFTSKSSTYHVHVTLWVTPPTFPCSILSGNTESTHKRTETIFSVWYAV